MTETRRRAVIAHFPNGIDKLYCPCGGVIVYRPGAGEPPERCAFCKRRYRWDAPSKSHGANLTRTPRNGVEGVQQRTGHVVVLRCSRCGQPEPCPCVDRRTFVRTGWNDRWRRW